ncbi:MAG: hypothetical protein IPG53_05425 [Ignavibacteriales bacterium]|nr:hypothetical protein [Ignavibacteriales bacterium]
MKKINELETLAAEIAVERHVIDEYDQINKLIENLNTSKNLKTRYDAIVENRQRTIIARDEVNSKIVASIEEMEGLPDYEAKITVEENLLSEKRLHLETLNERASDLRTNLNTVNNELKKCQSQVNKCSETRFRRCLSRM